MPEQSLLQIIREECKRLNMSVPATVTGSQNEDILQMWALMNEGIEYLVTKPWEQLRQPITFNHAAQPDYVALDLGVTLPDWRRLVLNTLWNRTAQQPVYGPLNPDEWQSLLVFQVAPALFSFRLQGHKLRIFPEPLDPSAITFALEYLSKYGVTTPSSGGTVLTNEENYSSDSSYPRIPTRVVKADLKWRYRQAKGLSYAEDMQTANDIIDDELGGEPSAVLVLDGCEYTGPAILVPTGSRLIT